MRFLVGFTLLFASIALIHGLPVGSQLNNLNAVLTQLPQYQTFLGQLNTILPQLNAVLSATDLQSLKDKITQLVLSQIGNKPNLDALKDQILPLLQQYLASKPQSRVDIDTLLQSIVGAAASALPGMILGLLGKRDVSADGRDLNQLLSLVDKYQLNTLIPQVELFLGPDKLQELQNQFFATVVTALGNNWNTATAAQMLQQLLTQFIPQIGQMRIDWDALAQAALNGAASALPGLLIGALGLLGKRDVSADGRDLSQLVALADKFQLTSLIPQVATLLSPEKLQELQKKFLAVILNAATNNWNSATLAQTLQQLVAQFVPQISQMRIDWDSVGQAALNGVVSALPSILIGALGLFGKRSLDVNIQQLLAQLPVNQLAQLVQVVLNSDKTQALSKLKQLLQQFFPNLKGMLNFDDLAAALLNQLNSFLPNISQTIFGNIFG